MTHSVTKSGYISRSRLSLKPSSGSHTCNSRAPAAHYVSKHKYCLGGGFSRRSINKHSIRAKKQGSQSSPRGSAAGTSWRKGGAPSTTESYERKQTVL
jgi:hypothetical protein